MKEMKKNDLVFFYHSNEGLEIIGYAKVIKEHYQDPTTEDQRWVAVDIEPVDTLAKPVSLPQIKTDERLKNIGLVRQGRLSVMPLKKEEFDCILELGS